jgi:hypothetical protein
MSINIKDLTLGQIEELQKLCTSSEKLAIDGTSSLGKHICVLQRGWVFMGDLYKNGSEYILKNASNVRIWGTSKGLGELAEKGPLSGTKLDPVPTTKFHELTVVVLIKCK